jgi:putative ABC transport system permease protein
MLIQLIVKNILHRPVRNGALIVSFAFIAASLFSGYFLTAGATESIQQEIARLGADIIVVPEQNYAEGEAVLLRGEPSTFFFNSSVTGEIEMVDGVSQTAPQIYIATMPADCCSALVQLIAIDPSRDFTISPWLAQHRNEPLGKDEIIIGSELVADTGSTQYFYGHPFRVAGKLEPTGTGVDVSVFLREEDARVMADESGSVAYETVEIPRGKISAVLVKVKNPADAATTASLIETRVGGVRAITPQHLISTVATRLDATLRMLDLAALVAGLISLLLITLISMMAASERMREIGILRALGATRIRIFSLIIGESVIIALAGGILGVAVSAGLLLSFENYLSVTLAIPLTVPAAGSLLFSAAAAVILTAGIGGVAAFFPAVIATGTEPYSAIRSGEL